MNIKSIIEGVLFISGKEGATIEKLKKITKLDENDLIAVIDEMIVEYERSSQRGLILRKFGDDYKLVTKPEINNIISKNFNVKLKNPLNQAMIETLAIIAYNEPCTRTQIHDMRKVDPTPTIEKLIEFGLVEEAGRSEAVGKPYLYQVTKLFYDTFGINSIKELPEIVLPNDDLDDDSDLDFFDSNRYE
ncbi:SMC-Scp complex subunit ScpB [Malacoplasma muris]|uniref:SMC-Scp complex subunit ScpB n=1 Tax=Malacoplasma muris TaxID=2119 RepID=UPI00398F78C9